jgi:hypothetical protein
VTDKTRKTAASVTLQEFSRICKEVDREVEENIAGVFAQRRTYEKAMSYADILSDPLIQGKTSWGIAEHIGYDDPGPVQSLMSENKWDPQEMWDCIGILGAGMIAADAENDPLGAGAVADETAQGKRGNATAGVGHQYAGFAGCTVNCTTWVAMALVGPRNKTWVSCSLYLPGKTWFTGRGDTGTARRRKAGVPDGTRFMTKPQIARRQYQHLRDIGVKFTWGGGDEVYGRYKALRDDHEVNGEAYAYFVPKNHVVTTLGKERRRVDELLELSQARFEARSAGPGVNGPRYYDWALIGVESPSHFLLIRRPVAGECEARGEKNASGGQFPAGGKPRGKHREDHEGDEADKDSVTFCLCYVPPESPVKPTMSNLVLMAGRRWGAEEANATEKGPAGWDENQFRKWDSLHRHTALAGLAVLKGNMISQRLEKITAGTGAAIPGAGKDAGHAAEVSRQCVLAPEPEFGADDLRIPLGDSLVPDHAGQVLSGEIGFIRLSVNEIMRLRRIALAGITDARKAFHLRWSKWRRRHQAIARWYHQIARIKSAAGNGTRPQPEDALTKSYNASS